MKKIIYILLFSLGLMQIACKAVSAHSKPKPVWVNNRPVNNSYYIGIGVSDKLASPTDYQQIAKKNALNDLVSEIKVTVSANSALSQFQNNSEFRQQFESETKISALSTIEGYETVDNWENKETYWVYYRLSKAEYEAIKRRKLALAISRAEDDMDRANKFSLQTDYMQSLQLKLRALITLQDYLNEDVQTISNGKSVYFVNEVLSDIQEQLYAVTIKNYPDLIHIKPGQSQSIRSFVVMKQDTKTAVAHVPLVLINAGSQTERQQVGVMDEHGVSQFTLGMREFNGTKQNGKIQMNLSAVIAGDSLNLALKQLLLGLALPTSSIEVYSEPLKIFMDDEELNLAKANGINPLETTLKKALIEDGCVFVSNATEAVYTIRIRSNTRSLGKIYGKMESAALDLSVSVSEAKTNTEIYKDARQNIKGFQTTPETAGNDAYNSGSEILLKELYPKLKKELLNH